MAQPVWTLSVDLQTKTATFQTGMSDAAKAARSSFSEIKAGADEMGRATSGSMMEARHGVMLLGEEFGVHLPRALTSFISSIGPVGAAFEAAFPFLAIIVGATLLLEHLAKLKQEGEQLTASQANFGHTVSNVLNGLNDKLLEAGIRTDELNHNHLGALHKQLELIDHQSLAELEHSFDEVAKSADLTMAQLKTTWYQFGQGSAGAMHALDDFKRKYEELLDRKDTSGAANLLSGTLQTAQHILELQKQAADNQGKSSTGGSHQGDYAKFEQAKNALKQQSIGFTEKEIDAQETLVHALAAQVQVQEKVNDLKDAQSTNARTNTQDKIEGDGDKAARDQAQAQKQAADDAQKAWEENYRTAVESLQENERMKIDATKEGSQSRLAAINSAIKEEESKGLEENGFYRGLLTARVNLVRQMTIETDKINADAGKEAAEHQAKMGELQVAADKENANLKLSAMRDSINARVQSEMQLASETYSVQMTSYAQQIAALDKTANDYANKVKALQDKELETTREHENQLAAIKIKAEEETNARIIQADIRMNDAMVHSVMQMLTTHKSATAIVRQLGEQMAEGMIANALKMILANNMTKGSDAGAAARKAFLAGEKTLPGVAGVILGGVLAAGAFASVMAFAAGGIVPGVGTGDTVPAMLTPGESVLPQRMTERLNNASGQNNKGPDVHIHHRPTYHVNTIDGDGMKDVLDKHADQFHEHTANHIRKMNQ
jgi:hypothetical protein